MKKTATILLFTLLTSVVAISQIKQGMSSEQIKKEQSKIMSRLGRYPTMFNAWRDESERKVQLLSVTVSVPQNRIHLYFNEGLAQISIREDRIKKWEDMVRETLGKGYEDCRVQLYANRVPIEKFVPNIYRKSLNADPTRSDIHTQYKPLSTKQSGWHGGYRYNIVLSASHGKCYDKDKDEWRWQRPSLFGSIEDLNTFEYVSRYIAPMLENSGMTVIMPRERDVQTDEIIVEHSTAKVISGSWSKVNGGFVKSKILRDENPFDNGSHLFCATGGEIEYPIDAKHGQYALYISYQATPQAKTPVKCRVRHTGGETTYLIDQSAGKGWVYVGTHVFDEKSKVNLSSTGALSADAVRLGGGMGNVERAGKISGAPRWAEAARYYMQYSGVPASIYAQDSEKSPEDYKDDYKSRGDWAAWLQRECNIPIDAVLALHTNSGINDSIFGTLAICYTESRKGKYEDGKSKMLAHDLADIVQTQVVNDIRAKHTKQWTRRSIYDKQYAEISRPDSPALLLELLSHQNLNDMRYALDPSFRFDVSRAIYKGILKFLSSRYGKSYVVHPLPPKSPTMAVNGNNLIITWKGVNDPMEPTAVPNKYYVYTSIEDSGFNDGVEVAGTQFEIPVVRDGKTRSYRITAANDGGESFPTETLSACFVAKDKGLAMVVNEFNRLSAPDTVSGGLDFKNFMPYCRDFGISGLQTNFERSAKFVDNDNPGWGASKSDLVTKGIKGNPMDNTREQGAVLVKSGYSYISSSADGYDAANKHDKVVKVIEKR